MNLETAVLLSQTGDARHTMLRMNGDTKLVAAGEQGVQDRSCLVADREELAGPLQFEIDPERGKPFHRVLYGKRGQYILDDVAIAVEIGGRHDFIRDITPPPA